MDLVKITGNDDESEDDTYKNLRKKLWISVVLRFYFYFIDGRNVFEFPFSKISGFLQLLFTLPVVFFTGWFYSKELGFLLNLGISICFH
jgi:Cu2+-exporting ATPase